MLNRAVLRVLMVSGSFRMYAYSLAVQGSQLTHCSIWTAEARSNGFGSRPELISSVSGKERAKRKVIGFGDLPPHLIKAITVTEDRSFFEHYGVKDRGIIRAFIRRYDADPNSPIARQGGSSITQQLVKNLLLSPEQTWRRKISEAYMSIILEYG